MHEQLYICLLWMRLGSQWSHIAKLMGRAETEVRRAWQTLLKAEHIHTSHCTRDELRNRVKALIAKLKAAQYPSAARRTLNGYKKRTTIELALPCPAEEPSADSPSGTELSSKGEGNLGKKVAAEPEDDKERCISVGRVDSLYYLVALQTRNELMRAALKDIHDRRNRNASCDSPRRLKPQSPLQRMSTEDADYDFAFNTDEGAIGSSLRILLEQKNFTRVTHSVMKQPH